jgi:hypothetical protein
MKIKGVQGGKKKGDPIEYSPDEKVPLAIQDAINSNNSFPGYSVFIKTTKIDKNIVAPNGDKLKGLWGNNSYSARGNVVFGKINQKGQPVNDAKLNFSIKFNDVLDSNGLPDLNVVSLEMQ